MFELDVEANADALRQKSCDGNVGGMRSSIQMNQIYSLKKSDDVFL